MSNHFTYEIDERNLRIQLKELSVPVKEEAWQKFESFSDSQVKYTSTGNKLMNFNLNLNRNVVLPAVFGIIIVLFSFLLVNFVSIKNPKAENTQKAETVVKTQVPIVSEAKESKPAPVQEVSSEIKNTEIVKAEDVVSTPEKSEPSNTEKPQEPFQQAVNIPQPSSNQVSSESAGNPDAKAEAAIKKKRRKRADVIEAEQLTDIRPTLVSDERDSEERPN
jgi:hypothetical protein